MGGQRLNTHLCFDTSTASCKMRKRYQRELGKAPKKTLHKRKALQPAGRGGTISDPDALPENTAALRKALFSHLIWNTPKQFRPQSSGCSCLYPRGLWLDSSLLTPNPASLSLDNTFGQHIHPHFYPVQQEPSYTHSLIPHR